MRLALTIFYQEGYFLSPLDFLKLLFTFFLFSAAFNRLVFPRFLISIPFHTFSNVESRN
jgi:hypothetical protein